MNQNNKSYIFRLKSCCFRKENGNLQKMQIVALGGV